MKHALLVILMFIYFAMGVLSCQGQGVVKKDSLWIALYDAYVQPIEEEAEQRYYLDKYSYKAAQADTMDSLLEDTFSRIDTVFVVDSAKDNTCVASLKRAEKSIHELNEINHSLIGESRDKKIWRGIAFMFSIICLGLAF